MTDPELPALVTAEEAETLLRIRNARPRITRWLDTGVLAVAGYFYPDSSTPGVPLYSVERLSVLATARRTNTRKRKVVES
jgi:hypothetical protein